MLMEAIIDANDDEAMTEICVINGLVTGWLDPEGRMFSCSPYEHYGYAKELVKEYAYQDAYERGRQLSYDEVLLCNGWVHIGFSTGFLNHRKEWKIGWHIRHHLSLGQKRFLEQYFDKQNVVDEFDRSRWEDEYE